MSASYASKMDAKKIQKSETVSFKFKIFGDEKNSGSADIKKLLSSLALNQLPTLTIGDKSVTIKVSDADAKHMNPMQCTDFFQDSPAFISITEDIFSKNGYFSENSKLPPVLVCLSNNPKAPFKSENQHHFLLHHEMYSTENLWEQIYCAIRRLPIPMVPTAPIAPEDLPASPRGVSLYTVKL